MVERQHQGMDRPGVWQVPEGSEQGKMEKTGCEIICGAPTTLAVKGLMMMMMTTYTQVWGKRLCTLPSHPTLGEPHSSCWRTLTNKQQLNTRYALTAQQCLSTYTTVYWKSISTFSEAILRKLMKYDAELIWTLLSTEKPSQNKLNWNKKNATT